jgi:hypothetical protein
MILINVILFLLLALSIAHMWSHASIFTTARNRVALIPYIRRPLICPECFSFWAGLGVSFIFNPLQSILYVGVSNIFCGLITHLIADVLYKKSILEG